MAKKIILEMTCPFCGSRHYVTADKEKVDRWMGGELIQNVLGDLSATEREQLISHICPMCQDEIFG